MIMRKLLLLQLFLLRQKTSSFIVYDVIVNTELIYDTLKKGRISNNDRLFGNNSVSNERGSYRTIGTIFVYQNYVMITF